MTTPDVTVVWAGAVGARVARRLVAADPDLTLGVIDLRPALATAVAHQLGPRAAAGRDPRGATGVVVLAQPRPHAELAAHLVAEGVAVISVSDDVDDVRALLGLDAAARAHGVPLVVGAAMSPGLSGLLARHLAMQFDVADEVHVSVHGTGGPDCARQHHRSLAGTALGWQDREWMERPAGSGRELCWFPDPLGAWDCYRAELADPILLVRVFPSVVRVTARMSANRRDRFTARLPMLSPPHREGRLGGLRIEVRGSRNGERVALVAGVAERAAIVAAGVASEFALAAHRRELPAGLVVPGQGGLDTLALLNRMADAGLSLREFVGTEARTGW